MTNSCPDTMNEWVRLGRDFNISPEVALALEDTIKNGYTYYTGVIDNLGHYVSKTKKCGCSRFYKLVIDMDTGELTKVPKQRLRKDKYEDPIRTKRGISFIWNGYINFFYGKDCFNV